MPSNLTYTNLNSGIRHVGPAQIIVLLIFESGSGESIPSSAQRLKGYCWRVFGVQASTKFMNLLVTNSRDRIRVLIPTQREYYLFFANIWNEIILYANLFLKYLKQKN